MTVAASTVEAVRSLASTIREHADSIEQERCLSKPVVRGLVEAGVFRMLVPRSLGGDELEPMTACRVVEELEDACEIARRGEPLSWEQRGLLWLSATQAATQALQAVDIVYRAGGASSVYSSTQLERCLRDIRAASQHLCVVPANYEVAGQLFFGAEMSATPWNRDNRGDAS